MPTLQEELTLLQDATKKATALEVRCRDQFISSRTKHEQIVASMAEGITQVDPRLIEHIKIPKQITCEAMFPSLYADVFDKSKYDAELAAFHALQREFGLVLKNIVTEARKAMEEYVNDGDKS